MHAPVILPRHDALIHLRERQEEVVARIVALRVRRTPLFSTGTRGHVQAMPLACSTVLIAGSRNARKLCCQPQARSARSLVQYVSVIASATLRIGSS